MVTACPVFSQTFSKQFTTAQQVATPNSAVTLGVGDLNGDGRPDILYTTSALTQNANGTFQTVATGQTFSPAAKLIDVNGDGKLDVVDAIPADEQCDYNPDGSSYCNIYSDAFLKVFLGNGNGTFQAARALDLGQEGSGLAILSLGDLNGDKSPDAVLNFTGNSEDAASATSFEFLNNGKGVFHAYGSGLPTVLASGDFNGDGKIDLVAVSNSSGLTILFGQGNGSFTTGPSFRGYFSLSATVGDFDQDGHLDIAVADNPYSNPGLFVLYGNGKGQFTSPARVSPISFLQVATADIDHDGYLDLIAGNTSVAIFTNLHNRKFADPRVYAGQVPNSPAFIIADFNRDGYPDYLQGNLIAFGLKGGVFSAPVTTLAANAGSVAVADFNKDGIEDVAVTNNLFQTVSVFTGSAKGYFNPGVKYSTGITPAASVAIGDVDGDGIPDLVVARSSIQNLYPSPATGAKDLSVLLGNADGTFRPAVSSSILGSIGNYTFNMQTYVADVNHDGKLDLIGDWGVALGNGNGTFKKPAPFPSPIKEIVGIGVGDFNRDGNPDIALAEFGYSPNPSQPATPTIYTLLGDGKGGFTISHQETPSGAYLVSAFTVADVDGDGKPDLVYLYTPTSSTNPVPDQLVVERGLGNGLFKQASNTAVASAAYGYSTLLIDDFNRDGHKDAAVLAAGAYSSPTTQQDSAILLGDGAGNFAAPQYFPVQSFNGAVINLTTANTPDIVATILDGLGIQRVLNTGAR